MNPTDLQRWLRQSIYDAPNSDSRKRILDEYVQGLIAIARAAAAVEKDLRYFSDHNDGVSPGAAGDMAMSLREALDRLETNELEPDQ